MKLVFNRLANHYIVLGCAIFFTAITALLAFRIHPGAIIINIGRGTILLLLAQMVIGIWALIAGIMRRLRTVQTLAQAAPLCAHKAERGHQASQPPYKVADVEQILETRSPLIYPSEDFSDRLLHQFFPSVILSSPILQDQARRHFRRAFAAFLACACFLLMLLSAYLGVVDNDDNAVVKWTALIYFYTLCVYVYPPKSKPLRGQGESKQPRASHLPSWLLLIVCAIFLSLIFSLVGATRLPPLNNWIFVCLAIAAVLPAIQLWAFFNFLKMRLQNLEARTQTSTRTIRLQGTLIPDAIYQHFVAAFKRETNVVLRCYEDDRRGSPVPGSLLTPTGGSLAGEILLESDPALVGVTTVTANVVAWAGVAIALAGVAGIYVSIQPSFASVSLFVACLTAIVYGVGLIRTAEFFLGECFFKSSAALFRLEGTFNTARAAVAGGKENLLQMQEESPNVDVRVKMICVELVSTVFANPGKALPFENAPRYILAFQANESLIDRVLSDMTQSLSMQNSLRAIRISSDTALPGATPPMLPSG